MHLRHGAFVSKPKLLLSGRRHASLNCGLTSVKLLQWVDKLDLIGIDFLWRICLECQANVVADKAIAALVQYSYLNVSQKLKKDVINLHTRFLNECYKRLSVREKQTRTTLTKKY